MVGAPACTSGLRPAIFDLLQREEALEDRLRRGDPADAQPREEFSRNVLR